MNRRTLGGSNFSMRDFNMDDADNLRKLLDDIDHILESYDPGELDPDRVLADILTQRADQRPVLDKAVELATEGLKAYPFNPELLRRRAWARCCIVTSQGEHPEIEAAEQDLRTILKLDPYNLKAGFQLLDAMFTFSAMEDSDVAEVAAEFAERAESILLDLRALQIIALGYADEHAEADELFSHWISLFPDSESLRTAKENADSMRPTENMNQNDDQ